MFLRALCQHVVRKMCARFLDGSRTLFENLGTRIKKGIILARPRNFSPDEAQFLIDTWRLEIAVIL